MKKSIITTLVCIVTLFIGVSAYASDTLVTAGGIKYVRIKEGDGIVEETQPGAVRDAGIIAAAQKVEHYEIATYGTLAAFAKVLKQEIALQLLLTTLGEEKKADELLTGIADTALNTAAMN